jgi:hypothetical protein
MSKKEHGQDARLPPRWFVRGGWLPKPRRWGTRSRSWARWQEVDPKLDAYAARRSTQTAVVILEPRPGSGR